MPKKPARVNPCFISDRISDAFRTKVNSEVCVDLPTREFEGNNYCILHRPNKDKADEFRDEIRKRFRQEDPKLDWVWFPPLILEPHIFDSRISFKNAYFSDRSSFSGSTFNSDVFFDHSIFNTTVEFSNVKFVGRANFVSCEFNCNRINFNGSRFESFRGDLVGVDFRHTKFRGDLSFRNVEIFSNINFTEVTFGKKAVFSNSIFRNFVNFSESSFAEESSFEKVMFQKGADFNWATFSHNVYFDQTEFRQKVSFNSASFTSDSDILFRSTRFLNNVDFSYATLTGFVTFESKLFRPVFSLDHIVSMRYARLESPEKLTFINVTLSPGWFMGIDSRKMTFIGVEWNNISSYFSKRDIEKELEPRKFLHKLKLFRITCRHLAENAEVNNRFEEASKFRSIAFECERLEKKNSLSEKYSSIRGLVKTKINFPITSARFYIESGQIIRKVIRQVFSIRVDVFHQLYRWTSGYGESWTWALGVMGFIILFFGISYMFVDFQVCQVGAFSESGSSSCSIRFLYFGEALRHSLATATFQSIESRKPITATGEILTILEKIFAPLQAALLALAIRRKFMR